MEHMVDKQDVVFHHQTMSSVLSLPTSDNVSCVFPEGCGDTPLELTASQKQAFPSDPESIPELGLSQSC